MSIIEVRDLREVYGGRPVVDGVSFSVEKGEIFGILGPNGAGKTTTVECIGGLRKRDGGTITVAGFDPAAEDKALREGLGIQLRESTLPEKQTVAEALQLYSAFYRQPRDWRELLDRLGLQTQGDRAGHPGRAGQRRPGGSTDELRALRPDPARGARAITRRAPRDRPRRRLIVTGTDNVAAP